MRIVLINPPSPWLISDTDLVTLGILYIVSSLRKEKDIHCIVCDLAGLDEDQWKIPVGDIYGVTGTTPHFHYMKRITEILKDRQPDNFVIWGGPHATIMPSHVLTHSRADICVLGESELIFAYLCRYLLKNRYCPDIPGVAYRELGSIVINHATERVADISKVPHPAREEIDMFKYSKVKTHKYIIGDCRETSIITTRGCPYKCSFCAQYALWGGEIKYRSIYDIYNEVRLLRDDYGINLINVTDDTSLLNDKFTHGLCKTMDRLGMYWHCLSRVDTITDEIVKKMYDSGCRQIVFGLETGSDKILKAMRKGFNIEQAYRAIDIVKRYDIKIRGQMVIGFPYEDDNTISETGEFMRNANVDVWGLHIFQPLPGSDVWNNPEKYDYPLDKEQMIKDEFRSMHTIGRPDEIPTENEDIRRWYDYLDNIAGERNVYNLGAQDK